ncbi:galactose-1-phosphate uridylyltransferase [Desulfosarcina variabilis]|uniref:galactose-1-phosphate uridylyltransferase n=1 Tax=Desulfosarcina variabilis TaxID=2300 RepID=UPI003AFAB8DB
MNVMLQFKRETFYARIILPSGETARRPIEIRTHPITGRTCRITYSRNEEREHGGQALPEPPPFAGQRDNCPFCQENLVGATPKMIKPLCAKGRMVRGNATLFPNLFPYGRYSAVSLFDDDHFVEIGTASHQSYTDSFLNCRDYLKRVISYDPAAVFMAISQNHLPSAGGSLVHPHLQVQADRIPANHQRCLQSHAARYRKQSGSRLFSDYLSVEQQKKERIIGITGGWHWLAAFAPEGFFEIWGILPNVTDFRETRDDHWAGLAQGIINTQRFYRSLGRNSYNLGLLFFADGADDAEFRVVISVRSNYAPWVRSDFTGFEVMLGDMATFTAPEHTAEKARAFWM